MPPKKKGGKKKSSSKRSPEEQMKDQLEDKIVLLREELVREREEKRHFQLESDKIQNSWDISRRRLKEEQAELRSRQREREEAETRHQETTVYKVKLKHLLSEHCDTVSALKADAIASAAPDLSRHTQAELELRRELHGLQAEHRDKQAHDEMGIRERHLKHQRELVELENICDERVTEMEMKYHLKVRSIITADTKKQQDEVGLVEGQMENYIASLIEQHDAAVQRVVRDCNTHKKQLEEKRNLKQVKLPEARRLKAFVERKSSTGEQENQRLKDSLLENQQKLTELQQKLHENQQAMKTAATKAQVKARMKALDQERGELSVGRVLLEQACEKVQQECEELSQKQTQAILDTEQESSLKESVLERKAAALTQTAEKKEAQLCAALSASNVDQTAANRAANKLQEMLESKQATIRSLQCQLAQDCTEYDDLLLTCKDKLKALGVPLYDFPFKRSKLILGGQTRVQDSDGPAFKE
ncbi:dynein regulatory complex subunit 4-like [Clinocottus analis]|uniref:dynein regulatory complex subunit 4-like n=1 Tax=Clinocottus analis TaxID=304258 RepID=UPI0035C257B3